MVIIYNKMEYIGKLLWFLIVLNAFTTYLMKIFFNKLIKNNSNHQKLLILNIIILIFSIPIDYFFLDESFNYYYLCVIFLFIDVLLSVVSFVRFITDHVSVLCHEFYLSQLFISFQI